MGRTASKAGWEKQIRQGGWTRTKEVASSPGAVTYTLQQLWARLLVTALPGYNSLDQCFPRCAPRHEEKCSAEKEAAGNVAQWGLFLERRDQHTLA